MLLIRAQLICIEYLVKDFYATTFRTQIKQPLQWLSAGSPVLSTFIVLGRSSAVTLS